MTADPRPPIRDLARAWFIISTQSIGGGPSVLLLIRRQMVERHGWLTQRQLLEDYAISKMSLGINLIALAGLIGWRVDRLRGTVLSVIGLVVPAAVITLIMTIAYVGVRDDPLVRAAISGAGPAAAGMTLAVGWSFARQSVRRGWRSWIDYAYAAAAMSAAFVLGARPIVIILVSIGVGAVFLRGETSRASADPGL